MELDASTFTTLQLICDGERACYDSEIWCPSGAADSCIVTNAGSNSTAIEDIQIYVDETYSYGFLNIQCDSEITCKSMTIDCEGNKDITDDVILYDNSVNEYYCNNGGASYCCPIGNCTIFNDPGMSFDTTLIDIQSILSDLDLNGDAQYSLINSTAGILQGTVNCTATICVIRCLDLLSCAFIEITSYSNQTVIECDGRFSCLGAAVVIYEATNQNVDILCIGTSQCL